MLIITAQAMARRVGLYLEEERRPHLPALCGPQTLFPVLALDL